MTMFSILLFGGCFAGFLTDYLSYQALNYQITEPRVLAVRTDPLYLLSGDSVEFDALVVAGFQGLSNEYRVTTLGRGGSDTTAVALAVATKSNICEIFTDVEGIFTSDPRIVSKAKKN